MEQYLITHNLLSGEKISIKFALVGITNFGDGNNLLVLSGIGELFVFYSKTRNYTHIGTLKCGMNIVPFGVLFKNSFVYVLAHNNNYYYFDSWKVRRTN